MPTPITRRTVLTTLASAALAACGGGDGGAPPPVAGTQAPPAPPAPLMFATPFNAWPLPPVLGVEERSVPLAWARMAMNVIGGYDVTAMSLFQSAPVRAAAMATLFVAGHDAANAVTRRYTPYRYSAPPDAGADAELAYTIAAIRVLLQSAQWPGALNFDEELAAAFARVVDPDRRARSVAIGEASAAAALAQWWNVPRGACTVYSAAAAPGVFDPYFPKSPPLICTDTPLWTLTSASQFRVAPPVDLSSAAYATDFDDVKARGRIVPASRTASEAAQILRWFDTAPVEWHLAAVRALDATSLDLHDTARLLALMQLAMADAYTAALESKFTFNRWRPPWAIRRADTDGNPATQPDAGWLPALSWIDIDAPEYPSAYASASAAAGRVLDEILPGAYVGDGAPLSWPQVVEDAASSAILCGRNFRHSVDAGKSQGEQIGNWVLAHQLAPAT